MNDIEADERRVLEAARQGLSPSPADAQRVLEATRSAMAMQPGTNSTPELPAPHSELGGAARTALALDARAPLRLLRIISGLALLGASAGAGYYAGLRAGRLESARHVMLPSSRAMPRKPAESVGHSDEPARAAAVASGVPLPEASAAPRPRAPVRRGETRATLAATPQHTLEQETQMLRRVERALRDQNPQLALDLLGDFERTMPGGKLVEERFAAAVMARCALGLGSPTTLLQDFVQRHPASVYFARVSQACEVGNRSPGAPQVRGPRP